MKRLSNQPFFLSYFFIYFGMDPCEKYFQQNKTALPVSFPEDLDVIVIIPVLDDRDIFRTLESLCACRIVDEKAGVLVVVNHSEGENETLKERNRRLAGELREWVYRHVVNGIWIEVIEAFDLPVRSAGVGLARKIAMDRAAYYFYRQRRMECPIVSLDADTWVASGYLAGIVRKFQNSRVAGVTLAYAHRYGEDECTEAMQQAIIRYELYLRYYQQALAYCGHPYAFTCIGSAFAVRAADYVAQGGMNKRQAGEDFYFIQKLISTGRFAHLPEVCVYPSSRFSERTPFGTGQAVRAIADRGGKYLVYHFEAFRALKSFFAGITCLYKEDSSRIRTYFGQQAEGLRAFLIQADIENCLAEVSANCASERLFVKRFFDNFNAFRVLKYLNFVHPDYYPEMEIMEAVQALGSELGLPCAGTPAGCLEELRERSAGKVEEFF